MKAVVVSLMLFILLPSGNHAIAQSFVFEPGISLDAFQSRKPQRKEQRKAHFTRFDWFVEDTSQYEAPEEREDLLSLTRRADEFEDLFSAQDEYNDTSLYDRIGATPLVEYVSWGLEFLWSLFFFIPEGHVVALPKGMLNAGCTMGKPVTEDSDDEGSDDEDEEENDNEEAKSEGSGSSSSPASLKDIVLSLLKDLYEEKTLKREVVVDIQNRVLIEKVTYRGHVFALKSSQGQQHQKELNREYKKLVQAGLKTKNLTAFLGIVRFPNSQSVRYLLLAYYPICLTTLARCRWLPRDQWSEFVRIRRAELGDGVTLNALACLSLARQLVLALQSLHDVGWCHSDLKTDNCLIKRCSCHDSGLHLTFCDFAYAVSIHDEKIVNGSPGFMPPEWNLDSYCSPLSYDLWALGGIIFILLSEPGFFAFYDQKPSREDYQSHEEYLKDSSQFSVDLRRKLEAEIPQFAQVCPQDLQHLPDRAALTERFLDCAYLLLSPDPAHRPMAKRIHDCLFQE